MTEKPYSKRELDLKFKNFEEKNDAWSATIMEKLEDLDKYKLSPTLAQAKLTNGRVGKLENWRVYLTGGMVVGLAVLGFFFKEYVSLRNDLQTAVDERFSEYEVYKTNVE